MGGGGGVCTFVAEQIKGNRLVCMINVCTTYCTCNLSSVTGMWIGVGWMGW